ncbi:tripartite tricarboxylate transporter TctB family protein [Sagittula sp. MA-2]|jgi:hypothetical protein|uniref:tripartite tricarboxylate transporter TctB family protein n=1 Tax=Sagittula sp. MA-2 TaxID=3048007 RepID=UPI0024C3E7D7|nr:tripartite tricarboxylate transporter TctB family protein [Sagittula sp. MA-2]WHZ34293.1 tripartite tricarboxylate transporter TctB family protein [Sagittula sp. MA-2]
MSDTSQGPDARKGRRREIIFASLTLIAAILFAAIVIPAGVTTPASVKHLPLSPAFLPYVLTAGVALFALVHLLEAVFAAHIPDEDAAAPNVHAQWKPRLLALCVLLLISLLVPETLGMLLTSIVVTIVLIAMGGERRPLILLGVGITVPLLIYLFFVHVAQVPMPAGIFEDWM